MRDIAAVPDLSRRQVIGWTLAVPVLCAAPTGAASDAGLSALRRAHRAVRLHEEAMAVLHGDLDALSPRFERAAAAAERQAHAAFEAAARLEREALRRPAASVADIEALTRLWADRTVYGRPSPLLAAVATGLRRLGAAQAPQDPRDAPLLAAAARWRSALDRQARAHAILEATPIKSRRVRFGCLDMEGACRFLALEGRRTAHGRALRAVWASDMRVERAARAACRMAAHGPAALLAQAEAAQAQDAAAFTAGLWLARTRLTVTLRLGARRLRLADVRSPPAVRPA